MLSPRPYLKRVEFTNPDAIDWNDFPYSIPAVNDLDKISFHADVTFLVGDNGTGKSTILEAIAKNLGFGAEGGTKNVLRQSVDTDTGLSAHLRLIKSYKKPQDGYFLRAESFFNIATYMDELQYTAGYGGGSLHARSHGEVFLSVLTHKLKGNGLYLLDEPEAALSPARQLAALIAIDDLVKQESQFIIVTHSPILMAYPNAQIYELSDCGIKAVNYVNTEHYQITKDFLNHFPQRLTNLFDE